MQGAQARKQDWADVIGPNATDYYVQRFGWIQEGRTLSWHWPAFFLTLGWLFYRKLWLLGLAYLALLSAGLVVALSTSARLFGASGIVGAYLLVFGLTFILLPLYANRIYFAKVRRTIARTDTESCAAPERRKRLQAAGGTHLLLALLTMFLPAAVTGLLIAASIPAYSDYAARVEILEGLALAGGAQAAVTEYYRRSSGWPEDNLAAGVDVPKGEHGDLVESVAIDYGVVVVTFSQSAQRSLHGRQLILNPDADRLPAIEWVCYSPDIATALLPAACRDQELQ